MDASSDDRPIPPDSPHIAPNLQELIESATQAIIAVGKTRNLESGLAIRDEIRRLPDNFVTEVLNQLILKLIVADPSLCRWFVLDVFLHHADPHATADVTERMNLLIADLRAP